MESSLPEGLVVRPLRPGDAEAFHALQNGPAVLRGHAYAPYRTLDQTRQQLEKLAPSAVYIGAWVGEALVGQVGLHPQTTRRSHVGQVGISVGDGWQRRGIGRHLMAQVLDLADNWLGLRRLELYVFADNDAAIALYRRCGFEIEARLRGQVLREGRLVDSFLMGRLREPLPLATE
jgi:L-phenylalanine/L-methionine N-acetyltransferase